MNLMTLPLLSRLSDLIDRGEQKKFYKWKEWKRVRAYCLRRDHNECQTCKRRGRHSKGYSVHHKQHVTDRPELALDSNNCEVICLVCHNREHPEKLQAYTKKQRFTNEERW